MLVLRISYAQNSCDVLFSKYGISNKDLTDINIFAKLINGRPYIEIKEKS